MRNHPQLPIDAAMPQLTTALGAGRKAVLSAEPGAGKTTRVPLLLLEAEWLRGKRIVMLEPRRLAARRAAEFMALQLGEQAGGTVGYRIRGATRTSRTTRIEVVTEGVLTRMLHDQADLPGVGLVIFDEYHERSIHADLGLALTIDVQTHLRDDLRILVMSATLDGLAVAALLEGAPVIESPGRQYPVETRYLQFAPGGSAEPLVAEWIGRSIRETEGDILVFLPGQREIRNVEARLIDAGLPSGIAVHQLYGEASSAQQQAALTPARQRKVILSTSIAETSLTIDGVRVVVDSGLARGPRFDPRRGMSGLATFPASVAIADQRRGRAGRQAPGICFRLWTAEQHETLPRYPAPEITVADLSPLALDLAAWGTPEGAGLRFLDPPPAAHLARARGLLLELGALDDAGALTEHGRAMARLPVHPRLAHMILAGIDLGLGREACTVAAILGERDLLRGEERADISLASRLHVLRAGRGGDAAVRHRLMAESVRLQSIAGIGKGEDTDDNPGILLALAYPERVAKRRSDEGGRYQMAGGTGVSLPDGSPLARERFLAIADVDGIGAEVRAFLAAPLEEDDLIRVFGPLMEDYEEVRWEAASESVVARSVRKLGALAVHEQPMAPRGDRVRNAMLEGVLRMGLRSLPWDRESETFRERSEWLRRNALAPGEWPDVSDAALEAGLEAWLGPFVEGMTRRAHLARLDLLAVLRSRFSYKQLAELDRLAPATVTVPTGSRIRLDYSAPDGPVLAVRLQEMLGQRDTPSVGNGTVKVLIHLLSPAGRPLAVTRDLPSFWGRAYPEVRKEMRGRYPKHFWPENPLEARPTRRVKRLMGP